jgi:hypothetical protein
MAKFLFAYHGGKAPATPEEGKKSMAAWMKWFEGMGKAVLDGGAPLSPSKTVTAKGISANGGANPVNGYSLIEAKDIGAALKLAKGCPILSNGGSVEVAEAMKM